MEIRFSMGKENVLQRKYIFIAGSCLIEQIFIFVIYLTALFKDVYQLKFELRSEIYKKQESLILHCVKHLTHSTKTQMPLH